jgi:hypothetical protein
MLATLMSNPGTDECVWYFINLLVDTSIGICLCFGFLYLTKRIADKFNLKYLQSGLYYEMVTNKKGKLKPKMNIKMYCCQLGVWVLIVIIVPIPLNLGKICSIRACETRISASRGSWKLHTQAI